MCIRDSRCSSECKADIDAAVFKLIEKARQWPQFEVALAGLAQVSEYTRHVLQVAVLAVAVAEAGEDAEHLELCLLYTSRCV